MSWKSNLRRKGECKARVKLTYDDQFIEQVNEHTHPPLKTKCEVAKVKAWLERRAATSNDTKRHILAVELAGITETTTVNLQSLESLKNYYNALAKQNVPSHPIDLAAIQYQKWW